jgi:hypothetical protein
MSTISTTRILHAPANTNISGQPNSWVWPLPRLDGAAPSILTTGAPPADGIEIGYPGRSLSRSLVPVFAAQDGIVTYADNVANGATLSIDHAGGWSTHYSELEHLLARPTDRFRRRRKQRVRAGDIIGHARRSMLQMRFALSRLTDDGCVAQDPAAWMIGWSMLPWFEDRSAALTTLPDPLRSTC